MARIYPQRILGHWERFLDGLPLSVLEFYDALERALEDRGMTGLEIARVVWPERGLFSHRRRYLQLSFEDLVFVVSAIPVGGSTFVSWWCGLSERGAAAWLGNLRLIGWLLRPLLRPMTFYRVDTMRAFELALHNALVEVIDSRLKAKGIRRLSEFERRPTLLDPDRP